MKIDRWWPFAIFCCVITLGVWIYSQRETDPYLIGFHASESGDYERALRLWTLAAEKGDTRSMIDLARAYSVGEGVPVNFPIAIDWLRRAAEIDKASKYRSGIAAAILGGFYSEGKPGVRKDLPEAFRWYSEAAEGWANVRAHLALGKMYMMGQGTPVNYPEALKWFHVAAKAHDGEAMRMIGLMHERGLGLAQSYTEAATWYRNAANGSSPLAHFALAGLYETGRGVPQNLIEAHKNYNLAAILSYSAADKESKIGRNIDIENAITARDKIAKKMTVNQINEARQQVWNTLPLEFRRYLD